MNSVAPSADPRRCDSRIKPLEEARLYRSPGDVLITPGKLGLTG